MAVAGSVNLLFKATTTQAIKGLRAMQTVSLKTTHAMSALAGAGVNMGKQLGKIGLGVGAATTAIGGLAVSMASNVRENQRWADSLGIPAKRLEALQKVGARYGIDSERMADATKDLNERVADAASGAPAMVEAFAAMGLQAKDLINLRADEQLFKVSEAIQKMGNAGEQSFRAMELMADAGFDLLPLIRENGAAFAQMTMDAENSNTAMSNLERGSMLSLNNSFTQLSGMAGEVATKLMSKLAPAFEKSFAFISKHMISFGKTALNITLGMYEGFKALVTGIDSLMGAMLNFLGTDMRSVGKMFDDYLITPLMTTINLLKKVGETGDASKLIDPKAWLNAQREAQSGGAGIMERIGASRMDGTFFDKMEDKLSQLLAVTEEGVKQQKVLDAKDKIVDSSTQGNKARASLATMAASAQQVNPNRIRLGNATDGQSMQKQQLDAQRTTAEQTRKMNAHLASIASVANGWMGAVAGGIGSGVGR
jgi:hypothetical protein